MSEKKCPILPADDAVQNWFEENIDKECSASSAIYKFRLWLESLQRKAITEAVWVRASEFNFIENTEYFYKYEYLNKAFKGVAKYEDGMLFSSKTTVLPTRYSELFILDESGTAAPEWDSIRLIGRVKDRFKELEEKQHDWRSFYCAWLEGRVDMLQQIKGYGRLSQEQPDFIREANNRDLEGVAGTISQDAHEKEIMMQAFDKVRQIFECRQWIVEGRGGYPYNDDRYKEEVRYMYDEFDALQKDIWKNIESRSIEYRKAIIKEHVKGTAAWKEEAIQRIKDLRLSDVDAPVFTHTKEFAAHFSYIKGKLMDILGEKGTVAGREEDAVAFAEWCDNNYVAIYKEGKITHWAVVLSEGIHPDEVKYTTAELYAIFKQKEK